MGSSGTDVTSRGRRFWHRRGCRAGNRREDHGPEGKTQNDGDRRLIVVPGASRLAAGGSGCEANRGTDCEARRDDNQREGARDQGDEMPGDELEERQRNLGRRLDEEIDIRKEAKHRECP